MLSDESKARIERLFPHYPDKRSVLIPALFIAQEQFGYISDEAVRSVAQFLELSWNEVWAVASFYSMFFKRPVGRHVITVCMNISCMICGAKKIAEHLKAKLGINFGQTTSDGKFTLLEVECLASCGTAPVLQVNLRYHENLTPEKVDSILEELEEWKNGRLED